MTNSSHHIEGNAVLDNFEEDLHLEPGQFNKCVMIFYVSIVAGVFTLAMRPFVNAINAYRRGSLCSKFQATFC